MPDTPVLIVGAGPAGCSTSFFLSKAGIAHTIIDKAVFPRDKVCGDGISGKSAFVLRSANEAWLDELWSLADDVLPASGLTFIAPNGKPLAVTLNDKNGHAPGFTARRLFLDDFLFRKLNRQYASVCEGSTVTRLERTNEGWQAAVQTPDGSLVFRTKLIVAADGDKSIVRKLLLLPVESLKTSAVGLRAYYSNVSPSPVDPENIELFFLPELLPGYFWIFPLSDGRANVGVGMPAKDVRDKKINLRELMLQVIADNPIIKDRFRAASLEGKIQGWGLPMGLEKAPLSGSGYLLTGDAAHLIDPFSGEGIGNALYSGMKAAQAIGQAIAGNDFSAEILKNLYDEVVYKRLWSELQNSRLLQRLSRYPLVLNIIVNKAQRSPALKKAISGMFTDVDMRKKMQHPGFYLRMLLNK
jgi:geranylgeranyl reductase family protein